MASLWRLNRHIPLSGGHSHGSPRRGHAARNRRCGPRAGRSGSRSRISSAISITSAIRQACSACRSRSISKPSGSIAAADACRFCRLSVYSRQFRAGQLRCDQFAQYLNPPGRRRALADDLGAGASCGQIPRMLPVVVRNPRFFLSIFKTMLRDLIGKGCMPLVSNGSCGPAISSSRSAPPGAFRIT